MVVYSASGSGLIKNGSMTGTHNADFYDTYMVLSDAGGIFSNAKSTELDYFRDQVKFYFETYEGTPIFISTMKNIKND